MASVHLGHDLERERDVAITAPHPCLACALDLSHFMATASEMSAAIGLDVRAAR